MGRKIPIGIEFYKEMIEKDFYYVDKTLMIKDVIDSNSKVSLFTRPRRFGKTLALTMLQTFFEDQRNDKGEHIDNSRYFAGKKITACGESYMEKMGGYPVISLTLKSAKQPTYEMAYGALCNLIQEEFGRHLYVLQGDALSKREKKKYEAVYNGEVEAVEYAMALKFLSACLEKYHGKNVIVLIDEYDVPLENAYFEGFYDKMISFIRSLFETVLKTNPSLEFGVITGCLRISRESIFTGLNNLAVISVLNNECAEHFGFTQPEAEEMLKCYGLEEKKEEMKQWYDGYLFGKTQVYNPWSVINYVKAESVNPKEFPRPYWSNTSSNSIVRELIEEADFETRAEIEILLAGGTIEKPVHEELTYGDIHESKDNLWNFLFFTGYLKKIGEHFEVNTVYFKMSIPNMEVHSIYQNAILTWFDRKIKSSDMTPLLTAIEKGDCETFGDFLSRQLQDTISFYDYAENYYHGFLAGLLKGLGRYQILSNRESGEGRPDLIMKAVSIRGKAFIIEIKVAKDFRRMEEECEKAVFQAKEQGYRASLEQEGYQDITVYGICFYRKDCLVAKG